MSKLIIKPQGLIKTYKEINSVYLKNAKREGNTLEVTSVWNPDPITYDYDTKKLIYKGCEIPYASLFFLDESNSDNYMINYFYYMYQNQTSDNIEELEENNPHSSDSITSEYSYYLQLRTRLLTLFERIDTEEPHKKYLLMPYVFITFYYLIKEKEFLDDKLHYYLYKWLKETNRNRRDDEEKMLHVIQKRYEQLVEEEDLTVKIEGLQNVADIPCVCIVTPQMMSFIDEEKENEE